MVGRRAYDLMYRSWAPWDAVGSREELRHLLHSGAFGAGEHPRAVDAGVASRCRFVEADLTDDDALRDESTFELLLDFGTIDDLAVTARPAAARAVERLSHPGSRLLFWCFYAHRDDLPLFDLHGPSKLTPAIEPGEETALFGDAFDIEPFVDTGRPNAACFLLTRRAPSPVVSGGTSR